MIRGRSKFVLRFDDIAPGMAWEKFRRFEILSRALEIPLVVGVVPDCQDATLRVAEQRLDFWEAVREWRSLGWTIAQHGFTHQYTTREGGIFGVGRKSEFAGRTFESQLALLEAGKQIMVEQGVWQPVFMAPGHSLDDATLRALAKLDFKYVTDGYGVYPYRLGNLVAVPQLFSIPMNFGFGVYTICLHVNHMSEQQISSIIDFVRDNPERFISFERAAHEVCRVPLAGPVMRIATSTLLKTVRTVRKNRSV